jgi:hypothetical protein
VYIYGVYDFGRFFFFFCCCLCVRLCGRVDAAQDNSAVRAVLNEFGVSKARGPSVAVAGPGNAFAEGDLPPDGTAVLLNLELHREQEAAAERAAGVGRGGKKGGKKGRGGGGATVAATAAAAAVKLKKGAPKKK